MILPGFPQFVRALRRYSYVPFCLPVPLSADDPLPAFGTLGADQSSAFLFDSHRAPPARYSYFSLSEPSRQISERNAEGFSRSWSALRRQFRGRPAPAPAPGTPPFQGGWIALLSYDCGRVFEPGWRSRPPPDELGFPMFHAAFHPDVAAIDHQRRRAWVLSLLERPRSPRNARAVFESHRARAMRLRDRWIAAQRAPRPAAADSGRAGWKSGMSRARFLRGCREIRRYISAGDIYQANYSQRWTAAARISGLDFFSNLRRVNPSPYAAYARAPGWELASSSPELLLRKRGRRVETRPIAGTRPRGRTAREDRSLAGELLLSPKERAEHIMLLDLERNDLGRVCRPGSVRVTEQMSVERYSHVMHIVSHVEGELGRGEDAFSALRAVFPGGTITGCPKVRCMEIIDELEPVARGPFYGSLGWIAPHGDAEFNLLIRTAVFRPDVSGRGRVAVQAGAGIVADSDPAREFEESRQKARALQAALAGDAP